MSHLARLLQKQNAQTFKKQPTSSRIPAFLTLRVLLLAWIIFNAMTGQAQAQTVQEGNALLERGWVNNAITTFRQVLQNNPQSLSAKLGLAVAYQRAGQDAAAWNTYQQVLIQDPKNLTALAAVGQLGAYRPEWQQSGIAALTTLLALQPENKTAQAQRALLYGYQGQFVEAINDYERILSDNPSSEAILQAAQVYTYSGDIEIGLTLFQQYLATGAKIPNSAITAYTSALQEIRPDAAISILTERLQSLPASDSIVPEIRSALAIAYQANQQTQEALTTLEPLRNNAAAQLPLARALSTIARQTQDQSLYPEAIKLYQQVLAQTSYPSFGLLIEAADVLSEVSNMRPAALQLYQQVLAQQSSLGVQVKTLWLTYQLGKLSRSDFQQQLQQVVQPLPSSRVEQQQLAQALVQINPPDPTLLETYQKLQPLVPFLQFRIAQIKLQQGDLTAAAQSLVAYRQANGANDPAVDLLWAEIERQQGNLQASAQRYEQIAARYANRSAEKEALRGLAGIRLAQGQSEDALQIYQQLEAAYPGDLAIQLGRTAIAYQQQQVSAAAAAALLNQWTAASPREFPPELFLLVGALPVDPQRETLYDALLAVEPNNIAINRRWVQLWAGRDPDQARARVNQLLAENPNRLEVYFVQAELGQALGDLDLAEQSYTAILTQQPNQLDALAGLAGVRFQQQRYREAETLYQQVLAAKPDDLEIRRVLADLSAAQDQPIAAWQQLRQIQSDPKSSPQVDERLQRLQTEFLRRRGFQPAWERY